jgi:hypothetical protein
MKIIPTSNKAIKIQFDKSVLDLYVYETETATVELKVEGQVMHVIEIHRNGRQIMFDGRVIHPDPNQK